MPALDPPQRGDLPHCPRPVGTVALEDGVDLFVGATLYDGASCWSSPGPVGLYCSISSATRATDTYRPHIAFRPSGRHPPTRSRGSPRVPHHRSDGALAVVPDGWRVTEVAERLGVSRQRIRLGSSGL
jgi:hypothetical protein